MPVHQGVQVGRLKEEAGFARAVAQRIPERLDGEHGAREQRDVVRRPIRLRHATWSVIRSNATWGRLWFGSNAPQVAFDGSVAAVETMLVAQGLEHALGRDVGVFREQRRNLLAEAVELGGSRRARGWLTESGMLGLALLAVLSEQDLDGVATDSGGARDGALAHALA